MVGLLLAVALAAHPIHTSVLELRWDAKTGVLEGTLRVYEDDLTSASRAAGVDALAYVVERVSVRLATREVRFTGCGMRRAADAVLVCLRASVRDLQSVRVRNAVLMDLHADQVNIVRVEGRSTRLMTAAAAEQAIE